MTLTRVARETDAESLVDPRVAKHGGTRKDAKANYDFPGMMGRRELAADRGTQGDPLVRVRALRAQVRGPHAVYTHLAKVPDQWLHAGGYEAVRDRVEGRDITDHLLTAREVAERLALSSETVLRWARDGRLPSLRLGRAIRFREAELERWLEERATPRRGVQPPRRTPPGEHPRAPLGAATATEDEE